MDTSDEFYTEIAYALQGCQLIEEQLKLYISEALEFVKKMPGRAHAVQDDWAGLCRCAA